MNILDKIDKQKLKKSFSITAIALFSIDALIGIFMILKVLEGSEIVGRIAATASILGLFFSLAVNGVIRLENKEKAVRTAALVAMIANIVWLIPWLLMVWNGLDFLKADCTRPNYSDYHNSYSYYDSGSVYGREKSEYERAWDKYEKCLEPYENAQKVVWKTINTAGMIAVLATLIANYMSIEVMTSGIRIMRKLTIVMASILVFIELLVVDFEVKIEDEAVLRAIGVFAILMVLGLLVTPILVKMTKKKGEINDSDKDVSVAKPITSPLGKKQIEADLRAQIEAELRPKIEAELRERIEKEVRAEMAGMQEENDKDI